MKSLSSSEALSPIEPVEHEAQVVSRAEANASIIMNKMPDADLSTMLKELSTMVVDSKERNLALAELIKMRRARSRQILAETNVDHVGAMRSLNDRLGDPFVLANKQEEVA